MCLNFGDRVDCMEINLFTYFILFILMIWYALIGEDHYQVLEKAYIYICE
jgi:hypothetical protein